MPILAKNPEKKSNFWNCCRNLWQKVLPKFLASWWRPSTPKISGDSVSWNSMHYSQSYGLLKFFENFWKFLIFEKFSIFWNLKIFSKWFLCHMDDHHGCKYFIIDMFYIITIIIYINCRLIRWRNMKIYPHVEVGTPKYTLGFKGLSCLRSCFFSWGLEGNW